MILSPFKICLFLTSLGISLTLLSCESLTRPRTSANETALISAPTIFKQARSGQHEKISTGWISQFKDPQMADLVDEALKHNQGLKAAAHRLRAAKTGTIVGRARLLPSLNASTARSSSDGRNTTRSESYSLSLNASWEPDLWGRLRNLDLVSQANYVATVADFRSARLSLAANTAQAWCNLVTAQQQLDLAEKTLSSYDQALPVVERRYRASTLRAVDVQFARNNVANAERSLRQRQLNRDNAARSLELLLGRYPSADLASSKELPYLSPEIPVGIPAQLLERRPDLVAARADLFASAQNAEASAKNLLPSINLTSSASGGNSNFRRAFDPNFLVYSIASSLAQTVYQGGTLKANARAALEQNRAAIEDYSLIALSAFNEVESAIQADRSLSEQQVFLEKEVKQSRLAEKRALSDITLGIDGASFLEYLEAQRRSESAGISLITLKNQRLQNRIDLHLALGGDYKTRP